jgi:hypothetical protein
MNRIILSILRRNLGHILSLFTLCVLAGGTFGPLGGLLLIGPLMLCFESGKDTITFINTLPVSSRALGSAYWLLGVLFPALLYLMYSLAVDVLWTGNPFAPLPHAMNALIGMGYTSTLALVWIRIRHSNLSVSVVNVMAGATWVGLWAASFSANQTLIDGYEHSAPWFYAVLLASPFAIGLSYRLAPRLTQPAPRREKKRSTRKPTNQSFQGHAWLRFWVTKAGTALACTAAFLVLIYIAFRGEISEERLSSMLMLYCVIAIAAAKLAGATCESSLRTFRALPMSSVRLTTHLVSLHVLTLAASMLPLALALAAFNRFDMVWFVAGYLALGLALALCTSAMELRLGGGETPLIYIAFAVSTSLITQPLYLLPVALILAAGAARAIAHLVQTRSESYRQQQPELDLSQS